MSCEEPCSLPMPHLLGDEEAIILERATHAELQRGYQYRDNNWKHRVVYSSHAHKIGRYLPFVDGRARIYKTGAACT